MISFGRLLALVQKERREMLREKSNVLIGVVFPVILLVIFGLGLSLDVKNIRISVVAPHASGLNAQIISAFRSNEHFVADACPSEAVAAERLRKREIDASVVLPQHSGVRMRSDRLTIQILLNATNANIVRAYENAIQSALARVKDVRLTLVPQTFRQHLAVDVRTRMWFNDANKSSWFLIPGVIALIMAVIGCLLTALQVAKEYERGTMESLFATPVSIFEILLAKIINNSILAMVGLALSLVFSRYVFHVPMRGSVVWILLGSSLFVLSQMGIGLVISSATKSQFLSAQISALISFLPVLYLSGFLYEIANMPTWLQCLSYVLPARYYFSFLQTAFLVGDVSAVYVRTLLPLAGFAGVLLFLAKKMNPKVVDE
ncbi:MAG: ABC transporter permease [Kiritimatiellia bacterium]